MMNQALFDVLPYMALEEYWIRTGEELAKGPAFLIVPLGEAYILILNNVGVIARYKRLKEAQNRIKELVENANYPMMVYRKKHNGKVSPHPFAENLVQRVQPPTESDIPVKAFEIKEWEALKE